MLRVPVSGSLMIAMPEAIHMVSEHVKARLVEFEADVETDQLVDRIVADAQAVT